MSDQTMINLSLLRLNLKTLMNPKILEGLAILLEALGSDDNALLERYKFFLEKNGSDCRYAAMAKEFFLKDQAESCAKAINWLYHNWSYSYENKK